MLKQAHKGHLGVTKTTQRAKDCMIWPGTQQQNNDKQRPSCLTCRDSNPIATDIADGSCQKIGIGLFHLDGEKQLLTIDYYSRLFDVDYLTIYWAHVLEQNLEH